MNQMRSTDPPEEEPEIRSAGEVVGGRPNAHSSQDGSENGAGQGVKYQNVGSRGFIRNLEKYLKRIAFLGAAFAAIGGMPFIYEFVKFHFFGPAAVGGAWCATAPPPANPDAYASNRAFQGCVYLRQKWNKSAVVGSLGLADFESEPELVGSVTHERFDFEFFVYNWPCDDNGDPDKTGKQFPTYGAGSLVESESGDLVGIWHEQIPAPGCDQVKPRNTNRWILKPSTGICEVPDGKKSCPPKR